MKLNRIRAVLEDKGISQTWLAKKLGGYIIYITELSQVQRIQ
jgi:hypothetical protein